MLSYPATEYVRSLQIKGSNYGLERTRKLLDLLGSPDEKLKIVHVAGTNGKGSVCAFISSVLLAAGKSVGTFTSPAVYSYEEQFAVNGVSSAELTEKYLARTLEALQGMQDSPTAFEIETCAALYMFCNEGCEYAVIECGLGGLTDATNAISKKQVAVINSISLEHTALLGKTTLEIARQKAGIIKDCPAVINSLQQPDVARYLRDIGGVIANEPEILSETEDGFSFLLNGEKYNISMRGGAQPYNAAVAVKVCEILGIERKYIKSGLSKANLSGRIEVIKSDKTYILDGAHNPASFVPLANYLNKFYKGVRLDVIYGCLSDKDTAGCLKKIAGLDAQITVVQPESYRAKSQEEIFAECKKFFPDVTKKSGVIEALDSAECHVVVVCGTFTVLKEAKEWIDKRL